MIRGVLALLVALSIYAAGFQDGIRHADAGSVRLTLNPDKSVTMRAYDPSGKIIAERDQSLDDPISTLWDY